MCFVKHCLHHILNYTGLLENSANVIHESYSLDHQGAAHAQSVLQPGGQG